MPSVRFGVIIPHFLLDASVDFGKSQMSHIDRVKRFTKLEVWYFNQESSEQ